MHELYVFSGSGSTLYLAEQISESLGDSRLFNIARTADKREIRAEGKSIGIICPVHAFGIPLTVRHFIEKISVSPESWCYLLINSAGMPMGAASMGIALLRKRGVDINASFHLKMPSNYAPVSNPPSDIKIQEILSRADKKLPEIIAAIREQRKNPPADKMGFFGRFLSKLPAYAPVSKINEGDRKFFTDDKCSACGVCSRVCPENNITYDQSGRPKWLHRCTDCFACFNWCPEASIQYSKKSHTKRRYHHPSITLEHFLEWNNA